MLRWGNFYRKNRKLPWICVCQYNMDNHRFFNCLDDTTLNQFYDLMRRFRKVVYSIKKPEMLLLDLDSTLLNTYGHQEGEGFNFHYQDHGYHPLVCYDGITGELLKIQLRNGTDYSSTGVMNFLQPLLDEFGNDYPYIPLMLRGDSGFTKPELYYILGGSAHRFFTSHQSQKSCTAIFFVILWQGRFKCN